MPEIKTSPADIWAEYQRGLSYNAALNLEETVQKCENFFIGKQWEGVNAPDLDKPVFNFIKPAVNYFIANVVSDDIGIGLERFHPAPGSPETEPVLEMLSGELKAVMERCGFKELSRRAVRDAAVDGDACIHFWFDRENREGLDEDETPGQIAAELVDNTDVFFSNPQSDCVEKQRYLLICFRRMTEEVREMARQNGQNPDAVDDTGPVTGANRLHDGEQGKTTLIRKYWRGKSGSIWFTDAAENAVITPPTDSGYSRYPVVWLCWERQKNRYHGQSAVEEVIPNQIFYNKLYAMEMQSAKLTAFPKIAYNKNLVEKWTNQVGAAVGVNGDPRQNVSAVIAGAQIPMGIINLNQQVLSDTKACMGANDTALGNVKPENASAIIAIQNASSFPLSLQKLAFYSFVESSVRIWLDMAGAKYGVRRVVLDAGGQRIETAFDFSCIRGLGVKLNIDVGSASYWSELSQVTTLSNLFQSGVIDAEQLTRYMPKGSIPHQQEILEDIRQRAALMAAGQMEAGTAGQEVTGPPGRMT